MAYDATTKDGIIRVFVAGNDSAKLEALPYNKQIMLGSTRENVEEIIQMLNELMDATWPKEK